MSFKFLKPVEGRQVPDPEKGGLLPPEGRRVELTQYWMRREADGDVIVGTPADEAPAAEVASTPATTKKGA